MARNKTKTERKRKHAASGMAKNKVSPAVKFADMKVAAGMKMSIAGAKMSEKMTHFRANLMLKMYRVQHPTHPVKRVAATESMKAAATERRRQKVARATDIAARKRALARECRAISMARHT